MNAPFKQDMRLGRLTTALGKDTLVLLRFSGTDHVNDLYEYKVEALSTEANLDFDGLIGTHAGVEIDSQNHGTRIYDGIVTEAQWAGVGENGYKYTLTLRPWFWLATQRRNQRIFHQKSVVQIIEELLQPYSGLGSPALSIEVVNTYPDLEYTVQYRESDFAFASRILERFGISYYFRHDMGSHTLVLSDSIESHPTVAGGSREYKPVEGAQQAGQEHFWEWFVGRRMTTGAVRLTDYNFKTPMAAMEVDRLGDAAHAEGQIESYDYPGDFLDQGAGKGVVGRRTAQERGQAARHHAAGDCTSLGAGMLLGLSGDQVPGVKDEKYLCLSATHNYVSDAYGSGGADSDSHAYSGSYVLMPATAPLAPERKSTVPVVQGPQTGMVVGEGEIDCDEYGRILVHLHWDLNKAHTMRCRVSQNWASKGWGGMVIPRIGMEVIVEFLEGDPDKPIVTGCVYNGKNDPPYPLPAHKTKSVFKTDSHEGDGFNELTFEDESGEELIYMHGQKNHQIDILNDRAKTIGRDQTESVGRDKTITVGRDHTESIGRDAKHTTGHDETDLIGNDQSTTIGHDFSLTVGNDRKIEVGDDHEEHIGGAMNISVGSSGLGILAGALGGIASAGAKDALAGSEAAGGAVTSLLGSVASLGGGAVSGVMTTTVEKFVSDTIGVGRTEQIGLYKNTSVGHTMTIHAGKEFLINCGKSKFIMDSDGNVTIIGEKFNFSASGNVQINGKVIDLN